VTSRRAFLAGCAGAPLILAACAGPAALEPPDVALADVRFVRAGLLQQDVDLLLSVGNPNTRPMPLSGMRVALEVNGRPLARGYTGQAVTLPRLTTTTVPVRAQVDSLDLVQQILTLGNRQTVDYVLSGEAIVDHLFSGSVPFRKTGSLNVLSGGGGGGVPTLTPL
jgi:LEA14-like dessication related protein